MNENCDIKSNAFANTAILSKYKNNIGSDARCDILYNDCDTSTYIYIIDL